MDKSLYKILKSISQSAGYIERDIKNICDAFSQEVSSQVVEDLYWAHQTIMGKFYDAYDPNSYDRTGNLYDNSIIKQNPIKKGNGKYSSGAVIGSFYMNDIYNISPDNVFDLAWNHGVRGLPKESKDGKWINPYWDPDIYKNEFIESIQIGKYKTVKGTPNEIFEDYFNHWGEINGKKACSQAENFVKQKFKKTIY